MRKIVVFYSVHGKYSSAVFDERPLGANMYLYEAGTDFLVPVVSITKYDEG